MSVTTALPSPASVGARITPRINASLSENEPNRATATSPPSTIVWLRRGRAVKRHNLRIRGISGLNVPKWAGSSKGYWRVASSQVLGVALPNAYWDHLGEFGRQGMQGHLPECEPAG